MWYGSCYMNINPRFTTIFVIIFIALLAGASFLYLKKSNNLTSDTINQSTITFNEFLITPPEGWTVVSENAPVGGARYYFRSPDYEKPKRDCDLGGYCNLPAKGTEITLGAGHFGSSKIARGKLQELVEESCSNCKLTKIITIDRKDLLFSQYSVEDSKLGTGEGAFVRGALNNEYQFEIELISPKPYADNKEVFEKLLNTIHFSK